MSIMFFFLFFPKLKIEGILTIKELFKGIPATEKLFENIFRISKNKMRNPEVVEILSVEVVSHVVASSSVVAVEISVASG